jgi:WD40 repeat protein
MKRLVTTIRAARRLSVPSGPLTLTARVRVAISGSDVHIFREEDDSEGGTVKEWAEGANVSLSKHKRHKDAVLVVAVSPDGRLLATGGKDTTVVVRELRTGRVVAKLTGHHTRDVLGAAFSPDGKFFASASVDRSVLVWRVSNIVDGDLSPLHSLKGHTGAVYRISFGRGNYLASAGRDGDIRIHRAVTGESVRVLSGHTKGVFGCSYSKDGNKVCSRCPTVSQLPLAGVLFALR